MSYIARKGLKSFKELMVLNCGQGIKLKPKLLPAVNDYGHPLLEGL